jgi:hypothetical protein
VDRSATVFLNKQPHSTKYGGYRFEVTDVQPIPKPHDPDAKKVVTVLVTLDSAAVR